LLPLSLLAVCWTAVSVVIGDVFPQQVYFVLSGVLFLIVVGGSLLFLRRMDDTDDTDDLADDPIISGERKGIGYAVMQIVGALFAGLFALVNAIAWVFDLGRKMGESPESPADAAETDSTAKQASAK
jgi:hypothetical protein